MSVNDHTDLAAPACREWWNPRRRARQLAAESVSAACCLVTLSNSHPRASPQQLDSWSWPDTGVVRASVSTQCWPTDENSNAGRIHLQLLAPAIPACTWDRCATLGLNGTTPRSRGSRHSLNSEHSASAHQQIEAISVQDGRAQAPPPTPCLIRTPGPPEQARAPQHSTCGTSRAPTRTRRPHSRDSEPTLRFSQSAGSQA